MSQQNQLEKVEILKVLVGSKAHGLDTPESDWDYRAVYVVPTKELLGMNYKYKSTDWVEGEEDNTAYEIGHFLHLATKSNPSILEVFKSPVISMTTEGKELLYMFPHLWDATHVMNAFKGYSLNQRKKFLDNHMGRTWKFAVAYIRVLKLAIELLKTGTFNVKVEGEDNEKLRQIKRGEWTKGAVLDWAEKLQLEVDEAYEPVKDKKADTEKANEFLYTIRKNHLD